MNKAQNPLILHVASSVCKAASQHAALIDAYGIYVLNHGCAPTGLPSSKLTTAGSNAAYCIFRLAHIIGAKFKSKFISAIEPNFDIFAVREFIRKHNDSSDVL